MAGSSTGGPANGLTWTNLISLVAILFVVAGGGWTIFQTQFGAIEKAIALQATINEDQRKILAEQISRFQKEVDADSKDIHHELRHDLVNQPEFREFVARMEFLIRRLDIIEATRPTTGELQSTAAALGKQVDNNQRQVDLLFQHTNEIAQKTARTPVESREVDLLANDFSRRIDALNRRLDEMSPNAHNK